MNYINLNLKFDYAGSGQGPAAFRDGPGRVGGPALRMSEPESAGRGPGALAGPGAGRRRRALGGGRGVGGGGHGDGLLGLPGPGAKACRTRRQSPPDPARAVTGLSL